MSTAISIMLALMIANSVVAAIVNYSGRPTRMPFLYIHLTLTAICCVLFVIKYLAMWPIALIFDGALVFISVFLYKNVE